MRKASTSSGFASGLADRGLLVVTGDVMESDSISVKVIEDGKTELVTLSIVRLRPLGSKMCSGLFSLKVLIQSRTHPPVLDQLTRLYDRPLGHSIFPREILPLTFPPVQKYLCRSWAIKPRKWFSLSRLSILMGSMLLARQ